MKTLILIAENHPDAGYLIGAVISVILLAYLVYTIAKPEKF